MKILICGTGSIALRHYKNLMILGYKDIIFYKSTSLNLNKIDPKIKKKKIYYNLDQALKEKPKVAFICNVTSLHVDVAIKCATYKCHLFVEKPISHNIKKISKLKSVIKKNKLYLFVGYMMRFHPFIEKIKKLIKKENKIFYASTIWGEYLPNWHPNENYKKSYAANKNLGGGVSLTLSHEIDLMIYLFGKIKKIFNLKKFKSDLKLKNNLDVGSTYLIRFDNELDCNIHINYLCNPPVRILKIFGEKIQINFDYYKSILEINKNGKFKRYYLNKFNRNDLFIKELKYFLKKLKNYKNDKINDKFYLLKFII